MTEASAFVLDGAAIADETLARVGEEARALVSHGRDARSGGRSGRRRPREPDAMSQARAGRPRRAASIRSSTICQRETGEAELLALIQALNADPAVHGILVQLPLPKHIDSARVLEAIAPAKDVDGFHPINVGLLSIGDTSRALIPCTPAGAMILIDRACERLGRTLSGMEAVIVGRSNIVGKPMAQLLLQRHCTVTIAHSRTHDLPAVARRADVLVAAVGKPEMVRRDWVKPGAIVIDVGINRVPAPGADASGNAKDASGRRRRLCGSRHGRRRHHAGAGRRRPDDHRHADGEHGSGGEAGVGSIGSALQLRGELPARKTKGKQGKRLALPWIPLVESGLFNGLQGKKSKKLPFADLARQVARQRLWSKFVARMVHGPISSNV